MYRNGRLQKSSIALVGFSDGYIRGYSKSGQVVLSEQLQTDAVKNFSCMQSTSVSKNELQVILRMCQGI